MSSDAHVAEHPASPTLVRLMHDTYLPFSSEVLLAHFAETGSGLPTQQQLRYYEMSASRALRHAPKHAVDERRGRLTTCHSLDHQIEKDERFWVVAALLRAYYPIEGERVGALTSLLRSALGDRPPMPEYPDWATALGPADELCLYFEVNLPSPHGHSDWLAEGPGRLEQRVIMPSLRDRARRIIKRTSGTPHLEGATKADAMLVAPSTGFAVIFEAKVMSDASSHTTFDGLRNQIARNVDVMLDEHPGLKWPLNTRKPEATCFVLITPEVFYDNPRSRLYGHLMEDYRDASLLQADLPHRSHAELESVPGRLGWTTWEECVRLLPGACPWLC